MIEYEDLKRSNAEFISEYADAFSKVLESGRFILDEQVISFEKAFASYCQAEHCVGVGSGLDALTLSFRALGLKNGSEVIVPSNTYIATILAVINAGLKPVLVEPDISTYNIDVNQVKQAITEKTTAIVAVHMYGRMCEMDAIQKIAHENGLKVVEDCAQAHGATYQQKKAGHWSDMAAFSFYPTKNLGCLGDGGAILTNNSNLAEKVRMLRNYGTSSRNVHAMLGYNSRLDEIQAAFLNIKLPYLDKINEHKTKLAEIYRNRLEQVILPAKTDEDDRHVYHVFNIRHVERDDLRNYLLKNEVRTEIHYPTPPHLQTAAIAVFEADQGKYPISEKIHNTTLSLPISYGHTESDIENVCELINSYFEKNHRISN